MRNRRFARIETSASASFAAFSSSGAATLPSALSFFSASLRTLTVSDRSFGPEEELYGIKGRQRKRCHIHHNTIDVNFSSDFPFEGDEDVEIDHNVCHGTITIPQALFEG